jgi:ABC-type phosphate transport system permease subunit
MDKIEVIQRSLRCFTLGLIGIVPLLGVPFALLALDDFRQVRRGLGTQWNPARSYLKWGLATAISGLFLTVILSFVVAIIIVAELASA